MPPKRSAKSSSKARDAKSSDKKKGKADSSPRDKRAPESKGDEAEKSKPSLKSQNFDGLWTAGKL